MTTRLLNQHWQSFSGEPVTGRVPPRTRVANNAPLNALQAAGVAHVYKLFTDAVLVTPSKYLVQHRTLRDGTKVHMVSNQGRDEVFVTPPFTPTGSTMSSQLLAVLGDLGFSDNYSASIKYSAKYKFRDQKDPPAKATPVRVLEDVSGIRQHPGSIDWWSNSILVHRKPLVVSWYGRATRYGRADYYGRQQQQQFNAGALFAQNLYGSRTNPDTWFEAFKPAVWTNGIKHDTYTLGTEVPVPVRTPLRVISAAVRKIDSTLWLYVVSSDVKLAVYRGKLPNGAAAVKMEKLFDIDFTVVPTGITPQDANRPQWEAVLQLPYFNASCTQLAGLVSTVEGSTTNAAAAAAPFSPVQLMTVNIDAKTTAFTASHTSFVTTTVRTYTNGVPNGTSFTDYMNASVPAGTYLRAAGSYSWGLPNETLVNDFKRVDTSYGAVDFEGDTLRICLLEHTTVTVATTVGNNIRTSVKTQYTGGTYSVDFTGNTDITGIHTVTAYGIYAEGSSTIDINTQTSLRSKYKAYIYGAGTVLAEEDTSTLSLDAIAFASVIRSGSLQTVYMVITGYESREYTGTDAMRASVVAPAAYSTKSGSGSRSENITGDYYWGASIEGGDLRRGCVAIAQAVEAGTSAYSATLNTSLDTTFDPRWGYAPVTFMQAGVTSTGDRQVYGRLAAWRNNVKLCTSPLPRPASGMRPIYGTSGFGMGGMYAFPICPYRSLNDWFFGANLSFRSGYSPLLPAIAFNGDPYALYWQNYVTPMYSIGSPFLNTCAFSTDGKYGYIGISGYTRIKSATLPPSSIGIKAVWIIDGVTVPAFDFTDAGVYAVGATVTPAVTVGSVTTPAFVTYDTPALLKLSAPLFIDNIPDAL